jgi:hypothetical protein
MLDMSLNTAFQPCACQRQDALGRRLPPTLKKTSTHALVIPGSCLEVALETSPESLLVHASVPAVMGPR